PVHGRVDLDEVVIGAGADVAAARRDDAGRDRAAEAERIADGHDPVADAHLAVIGEGDIGKLAVGIDLQHGKVGALVGADQLGLQLRAVIENDGEALAALDDVVVGDDVAVGGDDEARALRQRAGALAVAVAAMLALSPTLGARAAVAAELAIAAELAEEALE